jgi:hypothetical protein
VAPRPLLWLDRTVVRGVTVRHLALGAAIALIAVAARWRWDGLVSGQTPYIDADTKVFLQIAERPLEPALVFDAKPLIVPLVYRAAGHAPLAIARVQAELAFASWALLTAVLALVVRSRRARAAAIAVGLAFLLAPVRVGYTGSLLPESIDDSAMALVLAGALGVLRLRGRPRIAAAIATGLAASAWLLTRDTNAFIVPAAAAAAILVWRGWRSRTAWALSALVAIACALVLWTTTVGREPLPCEQGWYPRFTPRAAYPMVHNVLWRVYPDERDALPAGLAPFAVRRSERIEQLVRADPEARPLQDWLIDHGSAVYMRWLVRHPVDRVRELIASRWTLIVPHVQAYMPGGWEPGAGLRALTANHWLLLLLVIAGPWLLWRPRTDPLRGVALCVVISGVAGVAASYYGDATEIPRHCYGAGQQVVLGLFVALVAAIDHPRRRAETG